MLGFEPKTLDMVERHPVPLDVEDVEREGFGDSIATDEDEAEAEEPSPRAEEKKDDLDLGG